jgi:sirohydrochlorin cobaltochelatase
MTTFIVLASHGAPPAGFPHPELSEFFRLHSQLESGHRHRGQLLTDVQVRYERLESRMRNWPRNEKNDPFYAGTISLAKELEAESGLPVIVGFNEYCAPSLDEALEQAVAKGDSRVVVITPMMTSGGVHSEHDIPECIGVARAKNPNIEFVYAWPFDRTKVANFLAAQVASFASINEAAQS